MTVVGAQSPPSGPSGPPPPPGPGVQPPFAAPPTDGTRQRRWLAVGLASGFALLLCVGGLVGLGGIVVLGTQVVKDQSVAAVTNYLTAIRDGEYSDAYDQLCAAVQGQTPRAAFVRDRSREPGVAGFTVGEVDLSGPIRVPVTIRYEDGSTDIVEYLMEQNAETGGVEVCGQEG